MVPGPLRLAHASGEMLFWIRVMSCRGSTEAGALRVMFASAGFSWFEEGWMKLLDCPGLVGLNGLPTADPPPRGPALPTLPMVGLTEPFRCGRWASLIACISFS